MSSSNYGNYADCVKKEFVQEVCPKQFEALIEILKKAEVEFDDFCSAQFLDSEYDGMVEDHEVDLIEIAYDALKAEFKRITGLELCVAYHDATERSDMVDGGVFTVDKVYDYTPAGRKYKDNIERKHWITFG